MFNTSRRAAIKRVPLAAGVAVLALAPLAAMTQANKATGVTPTLLHQVTFDPYKVKTAADSPIEMQLKSKTPSDIVLRRHNYDAGGSTGWHQHPGPVFILVTQGTLTYYDYDDPDCQGITVPAGKGFVDDGHGHLVRNESGAPAEDVSVIMTTEGAKTFRSELDAPNPRCGF